MIRSVLFVLLLAPGCNPNPIHSTPDMAAATNAPPPGMIGALCNDASQCEFGVCLPTGRCSHACPLPACELGWSCAPLAGQTSPVCQCPSIAAETCNGIDDDCNGVVDNDVTCPAGKSCLQGECVCTTPTGGSHAQFVAAQLLLPQDRMQYAVDLNGDGLVDNQYGNIVSTLAGLNANAEDGANQEVKNGELLLLLDEQSSDPTFTDDGCAGAVLTNASPKQNPDLTVRGSFSVDDTVTAGRFAGPLANGKLVSQSVTPVSLKLYLPLLSIDATTPLLVPVTAAQLQYNRITKRARLNGVIREQDLESLAEQTAQRFDQRIQADPTSSTAKTLLQLFDVGGTPAAAGACGQACQNADGTCAKAHDGHISGCEVSQNSLIKSYYAPDVDMFDEGGNYAPNPANTGKDSLSIGFELVLAPAQF